ncbi:MAG: helix-turn-helix domain-containing protein, partial [Nitriliruptoraceae bacterium]
MLSAARRRFARDGYDGASIRAIAAEAGVDPALVHHYFGPKRELFRAAAAFPLDTDALLAEVEARTPTERTRALARFFFHVW